MIVYPNVEIGVNHGSVWVRIFDVIAIGGGALLAASLGGGISQVGYESPPIAFALLFALGLFPVVGMYRIARRRPVWRCVVVPLLVWLLVLTMSVLLAAETHRAYRPRWGWVGGWALVSAFGIVACRLLARWTDLRRVTRGVRSCTVAIVGTGEHCRQLIRKVELTPESRYVVATVCDTGEQGPVGPGLMPVFRDRDGFAAYVRRYRIKEVWLAVPFAQEQTILEFIELFRSELVNIRFIPDMSRIALFEGEILDLDGTSAINLVGSPLSPRALARKDVFDRIFALLAILAVSPLLLVIACAVKLSSPGPVLFRQRRMGGNGRVFNIYKFRSMYLHAEADGVVMQATRGDARVTRVGTFLRRTSLDELPQFFNVLRGEMSVVGPRPHALEHDELYQNVVDGYIHRYLVKPGITGWAQVNGFRGETDSIVKMQRRVEFDLYYLCNWSFALDMRIVALTVFKGLLHSNAY
jgi:Undecaprenyl-phosphate glucose phosphotransferase